jgi:hypothetical protein
MATTLTLGRYFEAWQRNHVRTDEELAEYLGVTVEQLPALASETVEAGGDPAGDDAESTRPMPGPPLSTDLDATVERYGLNGQRLRNVIYGRF